MKGPADHRPRATPGSLILAASSFLLIIFGCFFLESCRKTLSDNSAASKDPETLAHERGAQVIAEYLKRDAAPYRQSRARLTITSANEPTKVYELKVSRKQTTDETDTVTEIVEPVAEKNASLTIERKGQDATNVTYASALDRFRETGTGKMFFGGVTSQEFLGEWDKYSYRFVRERETDGVKTYEVEGTLKPERTSIIARVTALFRADNYLPTELRLFNSDGEELRHFRIGEYRNFGDRTFPARTEIENFVHKTKLVIETLDVKVSDKLDDRLFTRDHLKEISGK